MKQILEIAQTVIHFAVIVCFFVWLYALATTRRHKKLDTKKGQLLDAKKDQNAKQVTQSKVTVTPATEQQQAVQLVHNALENVLRHVTPLEHDQSEKLLSELCATTNGEQGEQASAKHCANCNAALDNAFDFCLKCSQPAQV